MALPVKETKYQRKTLLTLLLATFLLSSTSGCIDLELTRTAFQIKDSDVAPEFRTATLLQLEYTFDTDISELMNGHPWRKNQTATAVVKPGTKWLRVGIEVNMKAKPNPEIPPDVPIPDDILNFLKYVYNETPRYVKFTLKTPHDEIWLTYEVNYTTTIEFPPIRNPEPGRWEVYVEGVGYGFQDPFGIGLSMEDSYSIKLTALQPTPRR